MIRVLVVRSGGVGGWLDDRFGGARGTRTLMRKVFPDHWTFMLGEIALWSFVDRKSTR